MFDIGFLELLLIGVLSLLVLGPERLPGAIKTTTLWISRIRRSFQQIKTEIEQEIGADEIKQQIHNESIMKTLEKTKADIENDIQGARSTLEEQLGGHPYALDTPEQEDTLPYHEPLPDPYDLEEQEQAEQKPATSNTPTADKP